MNRRAFLQTAGAAAAAPLAFTRQSNATTTAPKNANRAGSSYLHETITTMCINTLKEVSTPGGPRSLINTGEVHTHLTHLFNLFESSGINAKIDAHIKSNGGFAKAAGLADAAPFSTKDLTFFVEELKKQGVALSKNDVHTINQMMNSRKTLAQMIDTNGIAKTQRAVVAASHPKADERWALYEKSVTQLRDDPSEPKMFVGEGAGGGQYLAWDPTYWSWWNDWETWRLWQAQAMMDEQVQYDDGGCACLMTWPDPDDPTNYTIYTEDVLYSNMVNTFNSTGGQKPYAFCRVWYQLAGLGLRELMAVLRADTALLEEVAFWMAVDTPAVLMMGFMVVVALILLSGFC